MDDESSIAEDILNGDFCQYCGQVFIDRGEGYPRTCQLCIEDGMDITDGYDDEN
jgi:hypothetical protein